MKKGFTLVELAIVLVVIGLVLGMAFKGKTLVDAARTKTELSRITKISSAVNVYYAKHGFLPGTDGAAGDKSPKATYDALVGEGLLTFEDFKSTTSKTYWNFIGCRNTTAGDPNTGNLIYILVEAGINNSRDLCIIRTKRLPDATNTAIPQYPTNEHSISPQFVCQIETVLDDKNIDSGNGLVTWGKGSMSSNTWDCGNAKAYRPTPTLMTYLYKVY